MYTSTGAVILGYSGRGAGGKKYWNSGQRYVCFVPKMCITYLSDSCRFLNCSVSSAVHLSLWTASSEIFHKMGLMAPPFVFFLLISQTNLKVRSKIIMYCKVRNPPQDGVHVQKITNGKGVQFICPFTKWFWGGCIHNTGDLKGV